MKLFGDFEAVKFREENLVFVTHDGYLYYIFNPERKYWRKYRNAGNDHITVSNYDDVSKDEIIEAMGGVYPKRETDFMRLCNPSQLCIGDMLDLLKEDYPMYMSDYSITDSVHRFLSESNICCKSFEKVKMLLDNAVVLRQDNKQVLDQIHELSFEIIGRDIFKKEISIVDGHDSSSYFWIMPVRVIDSSDTNNFDNVAEMRSIEISIEEDDVSQYLTLFLNKHFDDKLKANTMRVDDRWTDDDGNEQISFVEGFEWYLTYNFFTFTSVKDILNDIRNTVDALSTGKENEFTTKLKIKRGTATYELLHAKELSEDQINEYNNNRPKWDDMDSKLVIDFYRRFIYRMEYMIKVGEENGYDLISFMGP